MYPSLARIAALSLLLVHAAASAADRVYDVLYDVKIVPDRLGAEVTLVLKQPRDYVRELVFSVDPVRQQGFAGDGSVEIDDEQVRWRPPERGGSLSWFVTIESPRGNGAYDAMITESWAVFRGDDLVPPASLSKLKGARSASRLRFGLPKGWSSVTPYPRDEDDVYAVVHEDREFDRPTGWMALGELGVLWGTSGSTRLAVAGPVGTGLRHHDILAFLRWTVPALRAVFPQFTSRLLVVGAGDPMWRGGLSAPTSVFLHADRPLISENGTSTLLHELIHVALGVRAEHGSDWIVEAVAELYSIELLYRSGAISERHYLEALAKEAEWGKGVDDLFQRHSTGATTARAVGVLKAAGDEIRASSGGEHDLDDLARELAGLDTVSYEDLRERAERLAGAPVKALAPENVPGAHGGAGVELSRPKGAE
jgi:hypothetical protein